MTSSIDKRYPALAVVATCFAFNLFSRGIGDAYTIMLLPLQREFGWTRTELTGVYSLYLLLNGIVAPAVGLIVDRYGPRVVYVGGLFVVGLSLIAASTLNHLWQFYATIGGLVGVGSALIGMVPASALLARWYRRRLASMIGFVFSAAGVGSLILVPTVQFLVMRDGWRTAYRALGSGILLFVGVQLIFVPWRRFETGDSRLHSNVLQHGKDSHWTVRAALCSPFYWSLVRVFFFTSIGMYAVLVQFIAYLTDLGFSPLTAAGCFGIMSVLSVISVMMSGVASDRWGGRLTAIVSFVGTAIGMLLLLLLSVQDQFLVLAGVVLIYGAFQGTRGPIVSALSARHFSGPRAATIYGTILATSAVGSSLGALAAGILHDVTGDYRASLILSIGTIALAAWPFWSVRELRELQR
ncbi:MFS transporter [Paraburkholderia sp.]|uniref:MFS transporter n=1 Tax=Paraburkholderia sp. TaxID=1926495 RepID=UPI0039E50029